jgi:hypothetical protein
MVMDCDQDNDGIPDFCELDCNANGFPDDYDIMLGLSEDCNGNSVPDECDINDGASEDTNDNGIPDECESLCDADLDGDGQVSVEDILIVVGNWGQTGDNIADIDNDGDVDTEDLLAVIAAWGECP